MNTKLMQMAVVAVLAACFTYNSHASGADAKNQKSTTQVRGEKKTELARIQKERVALEQKYGENATKKAEEKRTEQQNGPLRDYVQQRENVFGYLTHETRIKELRSRESQLSTEIEKMTEQIEDQRKEQRAKQAPKAPAPARAPQSESPSWHEHRAEPMERDVIGGPDAGKIA